jgi:hypothetical protein
LPHGRIYKVQGAPLQNNRTHYPTIYLNSPRSRSRESPCNPLHKASSPGRRVLRISKRPEPVNIVSCLSCVWHEPFCYSRRHHPTPKNTSRGTLGVRSDPKHRHLVFSSMRLGVPFIAPRQLGAIESNPGRQILPSVDWRTGQSGADCLPYLAKPTVEV